MTDFGKLYADEAHKKKVLLEVLSERDAEIERLREKCDYYHNSYLRLRRELAEARADKDAWMHEFHATIAEQQAQLAEALAWIAKTPHTEDCDMAEPVYAVPRCTCGRDALLTHADQPPAAQEWDESKCTCAYATAENTASVRKGYEMGGYVKETCAYCASFKSPDQPTEAVPVPPTCECEYPDIIYRGYATYCGKCDRDIAADKSGEAK